MSVWKAACYRDDALQNIAGSLHTADLDNPFVYSLCDFTVEDVGDHSLPGDLVSGGLLQQVTGRPERVSCLLERRAARGGYPSSFARLVQTLPPARFGVHGIYKFVADNWSVFTAPRSGVGINAAFFDTLFSFGYAASYRTGAEAVDKARTVRASLQAYVEGPYQAIRDLISVGTRGAGRNYRKDCRYADAVDGDYPEIADKVPPWLQRYEIHWYRSCLILHARLEEVTYVFTRDDINRIERFVLGLAWSGYYLAEYVDNNPDLRARLRVAYATIRTVILNSLRRVTKDGANKLCRAYDVVLWWYCSTVAADVSDDARVRQEAKIREEKLDEFVDCRQLLRIAKRFHLREALELLQIYKAFPQPDFDYFGAAARQEKLYARQRPYGVAAETPLTGAYGDLWKYFEHTLIRSYHQKHGVCPGTIKDGVQHRRWHDSYPYLPPEKVPVDQVEDINYANAFRYAAHGTDVLDLVHDKAICPEDVQTYSSAADVRTAPIENKNYLMNVLASPGPIYLPDLHSKDKFDDVKAEDKPEAKKPNGRWFYEAHTDRRLVQSEYELSVAEYAKSTQGCMSGKSTRDKIATMNYICELQHGADMSPYRPLLVSFDLDKFSPSLEMDYHRRSDEIYANAFGQPHLANASDIYTRGSVHYIKRQIHHTFPKPGRDFEGFSGRKNTVYHCAVMGYCVRRLRILGLVDTGGRFASLIDDGLLKIFVRRDVYDAAVPRILQVIEEVYKMANLYISWDKTFVSEHFSVFLNEFNHKGTPVTPGIRSFLKVTNRADSLCPSFPDDLAKLDSTCRGAIAAGAPAHVTYGAYAYHVLDLFRKWGKGQATYSTRLALAGFLPVALGGFGLSSVAALSGSIQGPALVEGIGNMRAIAVRFRNLAPTINRIVNQPMRPMSDEEKLRAPLAVRRQGRCLKTTRGRQVLERKLVHMLDTPVIRALLGDVSVRQDDAVISALVDRGDVPIEAIEIIRDSSIGTAVGNLAAKFLRARTAFKLVRPTAFFRAALANATEVTALIREWR